MVSDAKLTNRTCILLVPNPMSRRKASWLHWMKSFPPQIRVDQQLLALIPYGPLDRAAPHTPSPLSTSTLTANMAQVNMDDLSTTQEKQVTIVATDDDENVLSPEEWAELDEVAKVGFTKHDQRDMQRMGKKQQFRVRCAINSLPSSNSPPPIEKFQAYYNHRIHELCNGHMGDFTYVCPSCSKTLITKFFLTTDVPDQCKYPGSHCRRPGRLVLVNVLVLSWPVLCRLVSRRDGVHVRLHLSNVQNDVGIATPNQRQGSDGGWPISLGF